MQSRLGRLLGTSLLVCMGGCRDTVPTSPQSPSLPAPAPQSYVVSGIVSETVDGISRPAASRKVDFYVSGSTCVSGQSTPCITEKAGVVETDQTGRYTVQVTAYPKTLVFVTGTGLHAAGQQVCLASALVDKDTTIDVQIFPLDSLSTSPPVAGPMITGFVYETTPQGRTPVRGVGAWLEVGVLDRVPVAKTYTDDAGRFYFCRVNAPVWMGVAGWAEQRQSILGTGDVVFEVELKR